jgi:hypothetical protein
MYQVWDGDLLLFTCDADEVDSFVEQGFKVIEHGIE